MAWTKLDTAGSWGLATTSAPASDLPAVLALPGCWPVGDQPQAMVRRDQWAHLAAAPSITAVSPDTGPAAGSTGVTVEGDWFVGATGVTFGGAAATGFIVDANDTITCLTPPHAAGTVPVVVQSPRGNATAAGAFTYE